MEYPTDPSLSASQLASLGAVGEERTARVGDVLFRRRRHDLSSSSRSWRARSRSSTAAGNEIIRCGPSKFLGELNLLSGQTVFLTAVVTQPLRYIAVEPEALRELLFEDGQLSDLLLSTFIARREALQRVQGIGLEIVGPRSSEATMQLLSFLSANHLPYSWHDESPPSGQEPPLGAASGRRRAEPPVERRRPPRARGRPRARAP